jgi:heptosyltransferase II
MTAGRDGCNDPAGERILVVRNRFIGDTVLAIPFLRNLRRAFPEATIDVLVEPGSGLVLADCPYKDELLTWRRPPRGGLLPASLKNILSLAGWLRQRRYTRAYVLKRSFSSGLLVWLAGISHRVGFASQGRQLLLSRAVPIRHGQHEVEHFLDLLRRDGIEVDDGHNENWISPTAAEEIDSLVAGLPADRRRVFLVPKATNRQREWPAERMGGIVSWLVREQNCEVVLCGSPADGPLHEAILAAADPQARGHVHDFSLAVRLDRLAALLSRMDLCLGIDTGLIHVSASCGVPAVVLFGPSDPAQWRPWGTPHTILRGSDRTTASITFEAVQAAAAQMLTSLGNPPAAGPAPRHGRPRSRSPMPIES